VRVEPGERGGQTDEATMNDLEDVRRWESTRETILHFLAGSLQPVGSATVPDTSERVADEKKGEGGGE